MISMADRPSRLSTHALRDLLADPKVQLVDVRPIDAYNGWRLQGEARGGHIRGARTLPFKWSGYMDWIEIVRAKEIRPEHPVIVYGYDEHETDQVARLFGRAGYERVQVYHDLVEEWCADDALPMERLPRYRHLVSAEWLSQLMSEGTAPEFDGGNVIVCHAHYRNRGAYEEGHIPGAIDVDTNTLESSETWNRRSPAEVREALQKLGITTDSTVILYGRFSFPDNADPFPGSSAGHLGAFRCAFIMLWAGVKDVRMLNGGLQAWLDAGLQVTNEEGERHPVDDFGADVPGHPELAVDLPEAKEILASADANLVSVRSWPEYIGEVSGYNYIEKKGRIPGSVYGDCGSDAYHMENYRNLDHTTREFHEIEASWKRIGVTPDKHNAFYCGTGWRGSEALYNAWLLGWPRVSVYDGGWFEWSNDPSNPIETGIPEPAAP
jgi:thiosulfate/3-mercaptopyruvate sulfurtransferase